MSDLVGDPEETFSHDAAHIKFTPDRGAIVQSVNADQLCQRFTISNVGNILYAMRIL